MFQGILGNTPFSVIGCYNDAWLFLERTPPSRGCARANLIMFVEVILAALPRSC